MRRAALRGLLDGLLKALSHPLPGEALPAFWRVSAEVWG